MVEEEVESDVGVKVEGEVEGGVEGLPDGSSAGTHSPLTVLIVVRIKFIPSSVTAVCAYAAPYNLLLNAKEIVLPVSMIPWAWA